MSAAATRFIYLAIGARGVGGIGGEQSPCPGGESIDVVASSIGVELLSGKEGKEGEEQKKGEHCRRVRCCRWEGVWSVHLRSVSSNAISARLSRLVLFWKCERRRTDAARLFRSPHIEWPSFLRVKGDRAAGSLQAVF